MTGETGGSLFEGLEAEKRRLIEELIASGITDPRVLAALAKVPRERFVPPELIRFAYDNRPLPIGKGQTISQPYIVALSTQALAPSPEDKVLEIGTGSGYQTAILAELAGQVFTVERIPELARAAKERLSALGYRNVRFRVGDGTKGWPEEAPFDAILVTAAAPDVPRSLLSQLREGGRMVIPLGGRFAQDLWLIEKRAGGLVKKHLVPCSFVPLVGEEGWRG